MTPGSRDEPLAPLSYSTAPTPDERPYGRGDRTLFMICALLAGTNLSLAGFFRWVDDREVSGSWAVVSGIICGAYLFIWGAGQYSFWQRRRDDLPPFSAFALACVACLTLGSIAANFLFARLVLR
jgi:hypothetical protein